MVVIIPSTPRRRLLRRKPSTPDLAPVPLAQASHACNRPPPHPTTACSRGAAIPGTAVGGERRLSFKRTPCFPLPLLPVPPRRFRASSVMPSAGPRHTRHHDRLPHTNGTHAAGGGGGAADRSELFFNKIKRESSDASPPHLAHNQPQSPTITHSPRDSQLP